jgi:hypothetical protein
MVLSPRVLHFADQELIWECNEASDCECGGDGNLSQYFESRRTNLLVNDLPFSDGLVRNMPGNQHLQTWFRVVRDYTLLSLTYPNDALPALSGIAKVFAVKLQDEYIAGLWRSTLVSQLLWYFPWWVEGSRSRMCKGYVAPSWSWASAKWTGGTGFAVVATTHELAEVVEVVCTPLGDDPTGESSNCVSDPRSKSCTCVPKTQPRGLRLRPPTAVRITVW